jgi:hypothetical protein
MKQRKLFPTSVLYIGIKGEGDANTNEILYEALTNANISTEHERKEYKGKPVYVWKVNYAFVKMFYREQYNFKLLFVVYMEIKSTLQIWPLFDPAIMKKAKREKWLKGRKLQGRKTVDSVAD